jgi:hypothetical protein
MPQNLRHVPRGLENFTANSEVHRGHPSRGRWGYSLAQLSRLSMERIKIMTTITTKDNTNRSFAKREKSKELATQQTETVWAATYDFLRSLKLTTFFGNPGSTEETLLKNFSSDFQYILGLQEATRAP